MNKKVNIFQRIMWSISGVEVWVLKDCPTAYKYYSRQGLLFVMTFLFAAFSGAFAGYDFGGKFSTILILGLVWGLLVYSIDQMMIQTIDKVHINTVSNKTKFWKYFFPRLLLGCLLALFMSSPLDHYIFHEQIENQMHKNANATWMREKDELKKSMDIEGTENRKNNYQTTRDSLSNAKNKKPETITFKTAEQNYENESQKLPLLKKSEENALTSRNKAWQKIPVRFDTITQKFVQIWSSGEYQVYKNKKKAYENASKVFRAKEREVRHYDSIMINERLMYEQELNKKIQQKDTIIDKLSSKIETDNVTIESKTEERQEFFDKLQGFDTKFMTLLTHPNFGVQFLRWFIFIVFLLIEILPTWMKLMGKPTEYDLKLDKIKKKRITEFEIIAGQDEKIINLKADTEIQIATEKEQQRKVAELHLHKQTLANVISKYENITNSILQDWEDKIKQEQDSKS